MVNVEMEETYSYPLEESIIPDYKCCHSITSWLQSNLESMVDDNNDAIFSKVNIGFSEDNVKSLGNRATCDVHINTVNFIDEFESSKIDKINSIIVFKLKGNNNTVADTSTIILDYLIQEFITKTEFRELDGIVSDTRITNAGIREQPNRSNWYCLGVIELSHHLF